MTAGFGANSTGAFYAVENWQEWRGQSFSIGGDPDAITLANCFNYYTKQDKGDKEEQSDAADGAGVRGASKGIRPIRFCAGRWCPPHDMLFVEHDGLNAAISGADVTVLAHQVSHLINQIQALRQKERKGRRQQKLAAETPIESALGEAASPSWVFVTLFIGMNDICDGPCTSVFAPDGSIGSLSLYTEAIRETLETLRRQIPYTVVQLVQLLNVANLEAWTAPHEAYCGGHATWMRHYLCPCTKTVMGRRCLAARTLAYNSVLEQLAEEYCRFEERKNSVVESSMPSDNGILAKSHPNSACSSVNGTIFVEERGGQASRPPAEASFPVESFTRAGHPRSSTESAALNRGTRRPKYDDFAVILGKTASEMNLIQDIPIEFVSPFDCFHPSLLGHQSIAVSLWNDLFKPHHLKSTYFQYPLHLYCPTVEDLIRVD
jgi:hypothetical protein